MKKILLIILSFVLAFLSSLGINHCVIDTKFVNTSILNNAFKLVIDPGHGGLDNGTSAKDGTREKDINLSIAKALYDYARVCGISTFMTRYDDSEMYKENEVRNRSDLYNRLDYINSFENAVMISIHQNFFTDDREWGMQIWYSPNNYNSKIIANNIQNVNNELLKNTNGRKIKESGDDYYILYKAKHPSIMIECGFMSNREENEKLKDEDYQEMIAYAIILGLNEYIGVK